MKSVITKTLGLACLFLLLAFFAPLAAQAQDVKLQLQSLDKLEPRASDSVDITLDGKLLQIAKIVLDPKKPDEAAIRDLVSGLKGIYVKLFRFDKEGEYSSADVDAIRAQLRAPGWTRMVGIKTKKESENVEVYMRMTTESQIGGITVITTDPKELSVINIAGSIDLEKLVRLSGKFGIPSIDIITNKKEPKE